MKTNLYLSHDLCYFIDISSFIFSADVTIVGQMALISNQEYREFESHHLLLVYFGDIF